MAAAKSVLLSPVQGRKAPNFMFEGGTVLGLTYTPNTSYTTGGDAWDVATLHAGQIRGKPFFVIFVGNNTTVGWQATWDSTNKKVQLWNGTTEFSNGSDASGKVFTALVIAP